MESTIRQEVLDELEETPESILQEQEGALKTIFNRIANKSGVLDKAAFLGFCRRCRISPQLISRAEIMEIYKATHYDEVRKMCKTKPLGEARSNLQSSRTMITIIRDKDPNKAGGDTYTSKILSFKTNANAGAKGDCLTFYGWVETLRRSAGILFSGEQWDETYPTESDKVRLLLFWIEQGEASNKNDRIAQTNTRIPDSMYGNRTKTSSIFQGNNKLLVRKANRVEPNDAVERAEAATQAFGVHDIRFSVAAFDVGGISTRFPQLLPHVDCIDVELKRLFLWYAGSPSDLPPGDDGDRLGMSSARFFKFIRECRILNSRITRGIVDVAFKKVTTALYRTTHRHNRPVSDAWSSTSFTKPHCRSRKSMVNRKMSYDDFYIALADLATRKYPSQSTNTKRIKCNLPGAALHKLLLHDILPMFARFWEKTSDSGTALTVESVQREQRLQYVAQTAGGSPEKRQSSWRRRWVEVHQLEDQLRRDDVFKAFHLTNEEIMQLLKAPSIQMFSRIEGSAEVPGPKMRKTYGSRKKVKSTAQQKVENRVSESFGHEFVDSSLASTHRLITRKLSTTSLAGVYLTQDKSLSPPPPPPQSLHIAISPPPLRQTNLNSVNQSLSNTLVESVASTIAVKSENDQELQNILNVVQSKITSLEETISAPQAKDSSVPDKDVNGNSSATDGRVTAENRQGDVDANDLNCLPISASAMNDVINTIIQSGKSPGDKPDQNKLAANEPKSMKKVEEKEHVEDNLNTRSSNSVRSNKKKLTPMKIGDLSADSPGTYSKSVLMTDPKSHAVLQEKSLYRINKKISRKLNGDVVFYETNLFNSKLMILQDRNYARDGIRLPRKQKRMEYSGTIHVRLQCHWKSQALESYRILLTSKEDSLFHFRHYTNKEMFDGIRQRHGFQVDFDRYPRVLLDVFDEASNPSKRDIEVTFAARRDGMAQFTISKVLYNGAKTINVLNLNFTQSSDKQREKDRMRLGHKIKRKRSPESRVNFCKSATLKSKAENNKNLGKTPKQSRNERARKRSAGKTSGGAIV